MILQPGETPFYAQLLEALRRLPAADFDRDLLVNIPRIFFEVVRPFYGVPQGYVRAGEVFHLQDLKTGDPALFWNGAQLGISPYPGLASAWNGEYADIADKVVRMAERTGARTVFLLGAGCGIGAFHIFNAAKYKNVKLRLVAVDRDPDAVRCADFIKVCHGITIDTICLDVAQALERPDDLVGLERLFENDHVIFVTHNALHPFYADGQYRALFDFVVNDLPVLGGVHREALAFRTPSYAPIPHALAGAPTAPPGLVETPSDPFRVLEDGSLGIRVTDRQEVMAHFLPGDFPSYLSWERNRR